MKVLAYNRRALSQPLTSSLMVVHPQFDPVALQIGPVAIRWYGLMYLVGFVGVVLLGRYRIKQRPDSGWTSQSLDDMVFYGVLGVVIGGRLGYVLLYKFAEYVENPLHILYVWEGGMSFHGGFLGVVTALLLYAKLTKRHWLAITDFVAPLTPLGLGAGRIGNFINAELWGRASEVPWAMVFPNVDTAPRHPSQLYEACTEGLLLFLILWIFSNKPRPLGAVSGVFLVAYGTLRFAVEFTREPDAFLGLLGQFSMGQWLSLPMVVAGVAMLVWAYRSRSPSNASSAAPK